MLFGSKVKCQGSLTDALSAYSLSLYLARKHLSFTYLCRYRFVCWGRGLSGLASSTASGCASPSTSSCSRPRSWPTAAWQGAVVDTISCGGTRRQPRPWWRPQAPAPEDSTMATHRWMGLWALPLYLSPLRSHRITARHALRPASRHTVLITIISTIIIIIFITV